MQISPFFPGQNPARNNWNFKFFGKIWKKFLPVLVLSLSFGVLYAQNDSLSKAKDTIGFPTETQPTKKAISGPSIDTVQAKLRKSIQESIKRNLNEFEIDKMLAKQAKFFADLTIELENTAEYLLRGIDTATLQKEITNISQWFRVAADGVFINKGTTQTSRNLTITHIILAEAIKRLDSRFEETQKYLGELTLHKKRIDSLLTDSILLNIPKDSASLMVFYNKAIQIGSQLEKTYRNLKNVISTLQEINSRCQVVHNTLRIKLEEVEVYRKNLTGSSQLNRELHNIWGEIGKNARPLNEILAVSAKKNQIVLSFYIGNHIGKILLIGLFTIILAYYIRFTAKAGAKRLGENWNPGKYEVLSRPVLFAIFITLNISQFFFKNPPFLFYASGWLLGCIILSVLFWKKLNENLRLPWLWLVTLFFITILENSILQASRPERWLMLLLALCILTAAFYSLNRLSKNEGNNRFLLIFVGIVLVMETISVFANVFGRYNMAKTTLTSGIFNLVVMILLLWTCYYIHELLKITSIVFNLNSNELTNENPDSVKKTGRPLKNLLPFPTYLNVLLITGWFILFMRNFYGFTVFTEPFRDFMEAERTIGAYAFSIQSIFNFFLIMFSATMVSKVVSFFVSDAQEDGSSKKGLGSWLLLVRITIFSIALFLAFAATGIAMDKIAIIFSALSVGIGFGLQTLVNNLVSGLIIAFEKPVNVGDAVDINGQSGVMKSIGFRSSVVSTYDGSDIIIPNGDLLNAHLINWTLGDTKRRVEVLVGVAYGTEIEKVKGILTGITEKDYRILRYPAPTILVKEFGASSIDFRLLFWIDSEHYVWSSIKSDVLQQIDIHFKEHGIEIPFAQQDINIRSLPDNALNPEGNT